jgi:plasmid stabilization system protein ParE
MTLLPLQISAYRPQVHAPSPTFEHEVDRTLSLLTDFPSCAPIYQTVYRRYVMQRFPYSIYFSTHEGGVLIHAVEHQHRNPARIHRID